MLPITCDARLYRCIIFCSNLSAIEEEKYSVLESFLKYFGFTGFTTLPRAKLTASATRLYVSTTEYMDFKLFQERFSLDDTFDVWCKLLQVSKQVLYSY